MIFGMPVLIEIADVEKTAELCRSLSLSFIELNMNLPQYQAESLEHNAEYFESLSQKYNIFYTVHLDENLNICDFNDEVRRAYLSTVVRTIQFAKRLHIPILNFHLNHGVYFTLPEKKVRLFELYADAYLKSVLEFKNACELAVGDADIQLCIENTNGYFDFEKKAISMLLESRVFALTWDIGHSNSCGNVDEAFILSNEQRLAHFHIHDSIKKSDHLALGSGEIDVQQRLKIAAAHNCRCVVETKTVDSLKKSVEWLKQNGYL